MVGSYHWPPEYLPILHKLLQMLSHLISDGPRLLSHDGKVTINTDHEGQILIGGWLAIWDENKLMGPCNLLDCCGVDSPELARGYPWPPPRLRLPLLLSSLLLISGEQE